MGDTSTIGELRAIVDTRLKASKADVRIVKKLGAGGWQSVPDTERLNGKLEFSCMGKALEKPAPNEAGVQPQQFEAKDPTITVTVDRALGFSFPFKVKKGTTISKLKFMMAAADPTGQANPDSWDVGITPSKEGEKAVSLPDNTPLTEEHLQLDLIPR